VGEIPFLATECAWASDVRKLETYTVKQSVSEHSHFEVYIARGKLHQYKSPRMEQILEKLVKCSVFIIMTTSVDKWSKFLATDLEVRVRFLALPDFLRSGSGTGSTQPREYK
jgi:hypothetical protein